MTDLTKYPNEPGVYMIRNLHNMKVYVGSSKNIKKRLYRHLYDLRKGNHRSKHLQNSYNKYGVNDFSFIVLDIWSKCSLKDVEQYFIDHYKASDREFGYNTQPIAYSNKDNKLSEETKEKISNSLKGRSKTEEHNLKNSIAHLGSKNGMFGKKINEKQRLAIVENNKKRAKIKKNDATNN